ncbi:MAG: hypothetical protein GF390_00445 [Candidatus Pacebacteria bacterium]|nr:hypothetical protein [Candidatus Paceibacterota bacterium]
MGTKAQNNPIPEAQIAPQGAAQPPKQKPWPIIGLIVLVLLLLGTTSYFAYQNYQLKKKISQYQPPPSLAVNIPTPVPTASIPKTVDSKPTLEPITDWKIYTNDKYNFTFKYPGDWEYQENYSKTQNAIDYLQITLAKSEYFNPIPKGNPLITITVTETVDQDKLSVYQNTKVVKTIVIGGITAEERKHATSTADFKYVTFINNGNTYEIESQMHSQSTDHQEVFDQILSTLNFRVF